tara:strand:+ start:312 stop:761 length:450 start_codon:yes stop_codon:yes gene_type:complete
MISLALYKPDIPQNTATIIRLCACFRANVHIIEPCGFNLNDRRFKRVVMDYIGLTSIIRYESFKEFAKKNLKKRIILMTTKAKKSIYSFKFKKDDILLFGRESQGVPVEIHEYIKNKLKIPIIKDARSLNVAITASISISEAYRQLKYF